MEDGEKTKEELLLELNQLRERLRSIESQARDSHATPSPDGSSGGNARLVSDRAANGEQAPRHLMNNGDLTESIDLTGLFRKDITSSGSFDIRGDIWSTTFGRVIQAVPIPVLLIDQSYTVTVANEAFRRISADYRTIIGGTFRSLLPDGRIGEEVHALAEQVFEDRKPRATQTVLKIAEATMWGRMTLRSIRIMSERLLLVLIEDLTAEKRQALLNEKQRQALRREIAQRQLSQRALAENELRFRQTYENAPMMMQTVDRQGIIRNVNSKWLTDLRYGRDEVIGQEAASVIGETSHKTFTSALETQWGTKEVRDVHLQYRRKDGEMLEVLLDGVVTDDPTWGAVGLWTLRDITHQMALEQHLRQAQKMEAIGTLAGGIAHDFNNLLQIIIGFADLLLMRKDQGSPDYPALHSIHEAGRRGSDLVNQILTFSRRVPTSPRPVNLNDVIEESVQLLSRTIPKVVEIELKLQDDLSPILIDPSQIEQVLINLLINAKDAMPQGGHVTICTSHATLDERYCRTYPEVQPGEYVVLNVSDTGYGMDKDVVDRIFEPFFTMKKPGEGTGLGLAIVFGIVKSHGGYISCRSRLGKGTTFELCFPAMELEIGSNASDASERPVLGTETILLVDDEEPIRNFATEVLSKVGYTVLVAADGREALEIYQKQGGTIDLVVLDLVMPKMGGVQCLEELLKFDPSARVLIVSGHLLDPHTTALIQQRAKGIVKKPLKVADVLRAVRGVLDEC